MTIADQGLALLAGLLSVLNPCVLPLLPVVFGTAASEHRFGPVALAGGLTLSFTAIGLFVATVGFSIGLDGEFFRVIAAVLMLTVGLILAVPYFQARFAVAAGPVSNWAEQRFGGFSASGLGGQFGIGLLLGAVWVPCSGPTIGAASLLASRGENLAEVATTMLIFGLGAALPLALIGLASRQLLSRWRDRVIGLGKRLRMALGAILLLIGALILTGFDRQLERVLVEAAPVWLIDLTTRF